MKKVISMLLVLITIVLIFLMFSAFFGNDAIPSDPLWGQYELRVMSGKDKGRLHSVMIYGCFGNESIYYNEDGQDVSRETRYNQYVYYKPASGRTYTYQEPLDQIPEVLENNDVMEKVDGDLKSVSRTVCQVGDTLIVEAQMNGVGTYFVEIEAKRSNGWSVVAQKEADPSEFGQGTAAIAEYTITEQDECLRLRSSFLLRDSKKEEPVKRAFQLHVCVGSVHNHFTMMYPVVFITVMVVLVALIAVIKVSKQKDGNEG